MIAYLEKTRTGFALVICAKPCNGPEYASAPRISFPDKKTLKAHAKTNNLKPWNF